MTAQHPIPKAIVDLALNQNILVWPIAPGEALRLCAIARGCGPDWEPIGYHREAFLRGAWVRHDPHSGMPLAVGRRALSSGASCYYAVVDDAILETDERRQLLFADRTRAMRAASLWAASMSLQDLCAVIAAILTKPADAIDDRDVAAFDTAMKTCRAAARAAAEDWPQPIEVPISLSQPLTAKAQEIIAELTREVRSAPRLN